MNIVTVERIRVRFQRQRDNTLLHKDKDLSTSWLFYKSVPDDKRKSERKRQTDRHLGETHYHRITSHVLLACSGTRHVLFEEVI